MKMSLFKPISLVAVLFISLVCFPAYTSTNTRNDLQIKQLLHRYFQAQDQAVLTGNRQLTAPFFDQQATKAMTYEANRVIAFENMQHVWNVTFDSISSDAHLSPITYEGDTALVQVSRGFVITYANGKGKQYLGGRFDLKMIPDGKSGFKILDETPHEDYVEMALKPNFIQPIHIVAPK